MYFFFFLKTKPVSVNCSGLLMSTVQDQGSDCAPVLGSSEATPGILCSILGPSLQEQWGAEVSPEKSNKTRKLSEAQVCWGATVGAGDKEEEGSCHNKYLKEGYSQVEVGLFS